MKRFSLLLLLLPFAALAAEAPLYEISGTAQLTWQAPTENVDGTPLTDLDGYVIYWSTATIPDGGAEIFQLPLSDEGATNWSWSFPMDEPTPVDWFFRMTAVDVDGNESALSNEVKKSVEVVVVDNRPPAPPVLESVELNLSCQSAVDGVSCTVTVQ